MCASLPCVPLCVSRNTGLEKQRNLLHSQLSSCQEQVATLRAEVQLYQKLLQDSQGGRPGSGGTSGRLMQLLEEVRRLREQLNQGVRNSNALAEQLHSKLDEVHGEGSAVSLQSSSGSRVHGVKEAVPQRSEGTQTTPTPMQPKSQTSGTWSHHLHDPQTHNSNTEQPTLPLGVPLPPQSGARVPLGGIGTLTVRADLQMSDSSTISLPQSTRPLHVADTSLTFTAPQSHSSPYTRTGPGVHHSSHAPSLSEQGRVGEEGTKSKLYTTRGAATGVQKSPHITRATEVTGQHPLDEYLAREGMPKLEPVMSTVHSRQSSSSLPVSLSGGGCGHTATTTAATDGLRYTTSSTTQTASHPPLASGGAGREYQSLESRLKQALESSTLQVMSELHTTLQYTCNGEKTENNYRGCGFCYYYYIIVCVCICWMVIGLKSLTTVVTATCIYVYNILCNIHTSVEIHQHIAQTGMYGHLIYMQK